MKKIIYVILLSILLILPVYARENKLYFTNSNDRLYYDASLYDDTYFMKHVDMIPGSSYTDTLLIENHTKYDYKLYMRVKNREQSELAKELLENIKMDIYLSGELLYEGFANGQDYNGTDLTNTIFIGEYKSNSEGELIVNTKLIDEYSNTENDEISLVDWEFIAEYNELVIPINPDTNTNAHNTIKIIVLSLSILFILLLILIFGIEKRKLIIKKL